MLRTDTGNFNRFLTSLGLLLLVAALLIPYFYFRETGVLRISQQDLRGLTPSARESLEARQRRIGDLEVPVAALAIALALGGVGSLVLGGRRLRAAQGKEDAALDRRARREDYEIERLSIEEVEKKRDEQAQEAADSERPPDVDGREAPRPEAGPGGAADEPPWVSIDEDGLEVPPPRLRTPEEARVEIARIEEGLRVVLDGASFEHFVFQAGVKIIPEAVGPRRPDVSPQQVDIDGLFEAKEARRPDVAMELKVTRLSVRGLKGRVRIFTDSLLALLARYRQVTGREVVGWLLVLVPEGSPRLSARERHHVEAHFERALAGMGRCTVLHEDDLDRVPQLFEEIFE